MIRIFADGYLVVDSRLEAHDLVGLKISPGLNVGGTAEIILPAGHPAYDSFVGHRTVVTIFRDGSLRFRGRALYHADSIFGERTVTCEGELCFLRDSINRPYNYESTPAKIFRALIRAHNEQMEGYKQFTIGEVDIPDEDIKMDSESAEDVQKTLNKLLDKCGGHVVFSNAEDGSRVIGWKKALSRHSAQVIEFGENLLDFKSTGANTKSLATGLIPYGAKDEETQQRLTIESVNNGKDYIIAEDAKEVRGTIMATYTWDDVTDPSVLLQKARAYLEDSKVFITSLELTALDLSYLDKSIDTFTVGDWVRVKSPPHGVDADFQVTKMTEDLLHPSKSKITLGKDIQSLTGADVAGDYSGQKAVGAVESQIAAAFQVNVDQVASAVSGPLNLRIADEETARKTLIDILEGLMYVGDPTIPTSIRGSKIAFEKEAVFPNNYGIRIANADGSEYYVLRVDTANSLIVGNDYCNLYLRGKDAVYLYKTGAAVTSDRREKNSIEELPEAYEAMLDHLKPVRFRYNGKGDRYHVGFVAQDVDAAMTEVGLSRDDFGGLVDLKGDGSELGLTYDEFIGLLLQKIRKLEKRLEKLEG